MANRLSCLLFPFFSPDLFGYYDFVIAVVFLQKNNNQQFVSANAKMESLEDTDYYERLDYSFILLHDFRI